MKPHKKATPRKKTAGKSNAESSESKPARARATRATRPPASAKETEAEVETPAAPEPEAPSETKADRAAKQRGTTPARPAPPTRALKVPPILLEGDAPPALPVSGPGQRYALGPTPPTHFGSAEEPGELPEAYGTKKLLLTARDPHWLYAHWDLTREQLREYNRLSADRHLVLRTYVGEIAGEPFGEVHVHPESRNWFVHVGRGGTRFIAELGYFSKADRKWTTVSTSSPTLTPPDALSPDTTVQFATIPIDVPFEQLIAVVKTAVQEQVPLAEAILQLRAEGRRNLPSAEDIMSARWTTARERALARIISMDPVRHIWMGSLEITELIRRKLVEEISSAAAAQFSLPTSPAGAAASVASPYGGSERGKGFWFNVNAELIIYGATEPDATVTMGGRTIKLRSDGSFSYRFALPDGQYELPVVAVASDNTAGRGAELKFVRCTQFRGDVGVHPQDPNLKAPLAVQVA